MLASATSVAVHGDVGSGKPMILDIGGGQRAGRR